jgi:hypothetical protein
MTLEEAGTVAKIIGVIGSALVGAGGLVWWMSALYSKVSSIAESLKLQTIFNEKIDNRIDTHDHRLNNHGSRILALEGKAASEQED